MCIQWTKVKWCFGRVFYHCTIFGLEIAKIKFLKKIRVLSAVFFQKEVHVISNLSSWLEKHQTPENLLMNDFL